MKHILTLAASFLFAASSFSAEPVREFRLNSPNGLTYLNFAIRDGHATYNVGLRQIIIRGFGKAAVNDSVDVPLLDASPLGLKTSIGTWEDGLEVVSCTADQTPKVKDYTLRQGKQSHIRYEWNERAVTLKNADGKLLRIEFRVSNNNVAFRYTIPQQGSNRSVVVNEELTGFDLIKNTAAFICPQSDPMIGWERTKPSYEEGYIWDQPATTRSQYGHGWTFPCLFRIPGSKSGLLADTGDRWMLISETGVSSDYCGSHLSDATPDGLMTIAFPMQGENNGFGSTGAQFGLAGDGASPHEDITGHTPWRTITVGTTLKPIVETTIPWDVVDPLYEPSIDYQGSRNTWSWILWQDASINYDDQIKFIDLAAALGWEGCLIDGGWYKNIGRKGMERLFAYCREKGVRPWVWYNSNGGWNNAPQCARQCMHNPIVRKQEMKWLRDGGVAGIKVDFFGGDKQETMRLYEGILSDANDYGIQVICHGCTLPRGWERMYPNYCSSEAVLASENLYFSQGFCEQEARHACLHPFVRNAVGSMEYGGTALQKRLHKEPNKGNTRRTSDVFELATAIAFQSSGQNFALTPRNLTEQPQFEIDFMKQVPTTWDETCLIDGYPGKYIVLARRHADRWYIAAMNAEPAAKTITFDPTVLNGFSIETATLLTDGPDGLTPQQAPLKLDKKKRVTLKLLPQCAAVIY